MAIRKRNIYQPNQEKPFKLSRSKIENFMSCQRCFYIDRRLGVGQPPGFPFNINSAVDGLLKKEFDHYREIKEPHPYMERLGLNLIPFQHEELDDWRENFKGVQYFDEDKNLIITGAVDDVWFNLDTEELIVVDYKATAKNGEVSLDADWQDGYRRQMDIYQWLLRKNGFNVSDDGYFVYCNGDKSKESFSNKVEFKVSVLKYSGSTDWIENALKEIKELLDGDVVPDINLECGYCSYNESVDEVLKRR